MTWLTSRLKSKTALISALLIGGLLFFGVRIATAHGYIVRSIPQDRASVERSPSRVQIWFSEPLEPRFSSLTVSNQSGQRVDLADQGGGGVVPGNADQLAVRLPPKLPDGAYIATMRVAFTSDGHVTTDTLVFWVGAQTGTLTSGNGQDVPLLEVIARAFTLIGMMIAFGGLFVYRAVLFPAWRNATYRAGGLAPRIMDALYRLIGLALASAFAGNILWLIQQSMALFDADLGRVFAESLWNVVANGTQFGDIWKLRMVLLIGAAAALYAAYRLRLTRPALVYPLWSINVAVTGAALGTLSLAGHAAGSTLWPLPSVGVDWLHLIATSAWLGGLIGLIAALRLALLPLDTEGQRLALLAVLRRFSRLAVVAMGLIAASGVYSALLYVYAPGQIVSTDYGRTLIAKMVLIAPLLAIGGLHYVTLRPGRFKSAERWLPLSLRHESLFGIGVILIAALLTATPPPVPPDARASATLPTYRAALGALSLSMAPDPNAAGANSYDVRLDRASIPLEGARVSVQFVNPAFGRHAVPLLLDDQGGGLYVGAGAEISQAGNWQALFDIWTPGAVLPTRIALSWSVTATAAQSTDRQASVLNWLNAASILIILGVWIIPLLRNRLRGLPLDPQGVLVGVGALTLTTLVMIGGALYIGRSANAYTLAANPAPVYTNPVLPDQASLDAGRVIYAAACVRCHQPGLVLDPVNAYVAPHSDADVFRFLHGTESHPYGKSLTDQARWSLINALRAPADALRTLRTF